MDKLNQPVSGMVVSGESQTGGPGFAHGPGRAFF
jgi:hypothetical protein